MVFIFKCFPSVFMYFRFRLSFSIFISRDKLKVVQLIHMSDIDERVVHIMY